MSKRYRFAADSRFEMPQEKLQAFSNLLQRLFTMIDQNEATTEDIAQRVSQGQRHEQIIQARFDVPIRLARMFEVGVTKQFLDRCLTTSERNELHTFRSHVHRLTKGQVIRRGALVPTWFQFQEISMVLAPEEKLHLDISDENSAIIRIHCHQARTCGDEHKWSYIAMVLTMFLDRYPRQQPGRDHFINEAREHGLVQADIDSLQECYDLQSLPATQIRAHYKFLANIPHDLSGQRGLENDFRRILGLAEWV